MQLFHVQDEECPRFVVAHDWRHALELWVAFVRVDSDYQDDDPEPSPKGVQHVADGDELLLGAVVQPLIDINGLDVPAAETVEAQDVQRVLYRAKDIAAEALKA